MSQIVTGPPAGAANDPSGGALPPRKPHSTAKKVLLVLWIGLPTVVLILGLVGYFAVSSGLGSGSTPYTPPQEPSRLPAVSQPAISPSPPPVTQAPEPQPTQAYLTPSQRAAMFQSLLQFPQSLEALAPVMSSPDDSTQTIVAHFNAAMPLLSGESAKAVLAGTAYNEGAASGFFTDPFNPKFGLDFPNQCVPTLGKGKFGGNPGDLNRTFTGTIIYCAGHNNETRQQGTVEFQFVQMPQAVTGPGGQNLTWVALASLVGA